MSTYRSPFPSMVNFLRGPRSLRPSAPKPTESPPTGARRFDDLLASLPSSRRQTIPLAVGVAVLSGVVAAGLLPRFVTTVGEMFGLMVGGLLIGVVVAVVLRSRWAILLAPIGHIIGFELARALVFGAAGFSSGGIYLGNSVAILVFIASRGVYALLGLLPMMLGANLGAAAVRRATSPPVGLHGFRRVRRYAARTGTALLALSLVAVAVLFSRPASTPPILGSNGQPLAGSVATLQQVRLGGTEQWILIRGRSIHNPVLLVLHGGPGQPELGVWRFLSGLKSLESNFIVVNWDQRGAGKSYQAIDPTSHMTLDQFVSDATQLTNYLRNRFNQPRIYIVGASWGTTLGTLLVQRHPELFAAYIGTGQMVSQSATDKIMWRDTIAWAQRTGRTDLAKELTANGPPPYTTNVVKKMAPLTIYADDVHPYPESAAFKSLTITANYFPSEYTILDGLNTVKGFADTAAVFYSQLRNINFLQTVPRLAVRTYVLEGRYENPARATFARQWFNQLSAPLKRYVVFAHSGHGVMSGDPDGFAHYLVNTVLPETRTRATGK